MKIHNILFNRYLFRQRLIMIFVSLFICAITTLTVLLASRGQEGVMAIILLIIVISIWFFPIYLIVITLINYSNLKKEIINIGDEKKLLDRMTNQLIRELVVKNGIKVSILIDKKSDFEKFNKVIDEELRFQRKKMNY
ncbi:MAG: hypothetical protein ACRC1F_01160 [Metamycoplasmataceae bacterium]